MRNVLASHSEVAHFWANQVQSGGRSGNMFFRNEKIYSYGDHFCIARHLPGGTVAFTARSYSSSTSKHIAIVRSSIRHLGVVYCYDPSDSAERNMRHARKDIEALLEQAQKPRLHQRTRVTLRSSALSVAENANAYLTALDPLEAEGQSLIDLTNLEGVKQELEAQRQAEQAAAQKRQVQLQAELQVNAQKWRNGGSTYGLWGLAPMLRLSADGSKVETSHGAVIDVSDALALWPVVQRVMRGERDFEPGSPVGNYRLTKIRRDGSMVVGCHDIAFAELKRIAVALKLIESEDLIAA